MSSTPADEKIQAQRLRLAVGRLARRMKQIYDEREVTFSETSILSRLQREGPTTPTALAAAEHVRPQAMGNTLTALEQRGLISRTPDPTDGRRFIVSIEPAGRDVLETKSELVNSALRDAASGFTASERRRLSTAIDLLERLADRL